MCTGPGRWAAPPGPAPTSSTRSRPVLVEAPSVLFGSDGGKPRAAGAETPAMPAPLRLQGREQEGLSLPSQPRCKANLPLLDPWFWHVTLTFPMISGYFFPQLPAVLRSALPEKGLQAMKGLRRICTFAVLNTQRTPFPMHSPCAAHKPGASTCPSFLTCYQHHPVLSNSCSRGKPCRPCQRRHSPPCRDARGSHVAVTFLLPFRASGSSSSTQRSRHMLGWQHLLLTMPGSVGVDCPGNDGCSGGQDSHPPTSASATNTNF